MSYVGEAGWEISCKSSNATVLYAAMIKLGARPAGLFAQTSMRVEKGFCAMGHELDSDITPVECGLDFATRNKGGFTGADALEKCRAASAVSKVVSLTLDDEQANLIGHEPIYLDGKIIGQITTWAFGYRVGKPIALGHVSTPVENGATVQVDIAHEMFTATVTVGPLFDASGTRMKT